VRGPHSDRESAARTGELTTNRPFQQYHPTATAWAGILPWGVGSIGAANRGMSREPCRTAGHFRNNGLPRDQALPLSPPATEGGLFLFLFLGLEFELFDLQRGFHLGSPVFARGGR
jgi:hypothetical protein